MEEAVFGPETWTKGDRGLLNPAHTDKPKLLNVRVLADGGLISRPAAESTIIVDTSAALTLISDRVRAFIIGGHMVVMGTLYNEAYTLDDGVRRKRYNATASSPEDVYGPVNLISLSEALVGEHYFDLGYVDPSLYVWPDLFVGINMDMGFADINTDFGLTGFTCYGSMIHQGRAFYWGSENPVSGPGAAAALYENRLFYSDPYAYTTFSSASQYFDVDGVILGAVSLGSKLYIWTAGGRWYTLLGVGDPAEATLSYIGQGRIPASNRWPVVVDNAAFFLSSDMESLCILENNLPDDQALKYLGSSGLPVVYAAANTPISPYGTSINNYIVVPREDDLAVNQNGVWVSDEENPVYTDAHFQVSNNKFKEYRLYEQQGFGEVDIQPRPLASETPSGLVGQIKLPRISIPGKKVRVRRITSDIRAYTPGFGDMQLDVTASDGKNVDDAYTVGPGTTALAAPASEGDHRQVVHTAAPQEFTHFVDISIDFADLILDRVTVLFEISEEPIL